jgi:NDP-mannose synthase
LRQLRRHGICEVVISIGYLGELIQAYFTARGGIPGLTITYLRETQPLGTAGPIALLGDVGDDLLVVNGDILTTFDFARMIEFHRRARPALTIAVHRRTMTIDLGVLEVDEHSIVRSFAEKPSLEYECSMGINLYSPTAVRAIERGEVLDFPALTDRLLGRGEKVLAFRSECYWADIGRREDYEQAGVDFARMRHDFLRDELTPDSPAPRPAD